MTGDRDRSLRNQKNVQGSGPTNVCYASECVAKLSLGPRANRDSVGLRGDSRERSMMGRREGGQGQFFYAFDLDKIVPPDHLVRQIDSVIDLSWVHQELDNAGHPKACGRTAPRNSGKSDGRPGSKNVTWRPVSVGGEGTLILAVC